MSINLTGISPNIANTISQTGYSLKKSSLSIKATKDKAAAEKASKEFETVYVGEFLKSLFPKDAGNNLFGGKEGENAFQSYLVDEYAKSVVNQGGFGIAKQVYNQLIKSQEARTEVKNAAPIRPQ